MLITQFIFFASISAVKGRSPRSKISSSSSSSSSLRIHYLRCDGITLSGAVALVQARFFGLSGSTGNECVPLISASGFGVQRRAAWSVSVG